MYNVNSDEPFTSANPVSQVTYRLLSRALKVHVNAAKELVKRDESAAMS